MLKEEKDAIIKEYATHEGDTGSPEVQVREEAFSITSSRLTLNVIVLSSQDSVSVNNCYGAVCKGADCLVSILLRN